MPSTPKVTARTFYLNEQHELSRGEKPGGGRIPQYLDVDWASKGRQISQSLQDVRSAIRASKDPLTDKHYFVLATPVAELRKRSKDKKKAPEGVLSEVIDFAKEESRVFRRLGLDLLQVADDGRAMVHMRPERVEQLISTSELLEEVGSREHARWAAIDLFGLIPLELRVDDGWLRSLKPYGLADAVIEFQPLLTRSEIDTLLRAISSVLREQYREALTGMGSDFSGRHWVRGKLTPETLRAVARAFYSVQTLHSPLISYVSAPRPEGKSRPLPQTTAVPKRAIQDVSSLPTVAILDTGVPADHSQLAPYRRGAFVAAGSYGSPVGDHGSFVASRVVFGDPDFGGGLPSTPQGTCRYYDIIACLNVEEIDDKSVVPAMTAVVGTAPDVRVFNLSFDTRPLGLLEKTKQRENLTLVQDLDNFVFQNDIVVVVSAGNSPTGVQPSAQYPLVHDDTEWQLGAWARGFNVLTCGSFVDRLHAGALVQNVGWPSPFTRMGPGLCKSPKPDFSAPGGNCTPTMQFAPGLGVWGLTGAAVWEDRCGTSFAAPLLAREAAFICESLQTVCQQGARPYAVTVKAFLALTALPPNVGGPAIHLAERTLGRGRASSERLYRPRVDTAVMVWQGVLEGYEDVARIKIPIPKAWYGEAKQPKLRLVATWDPPVNAAASRLWTTRKVLAHLKQSPESKSIHGSRSGHESYPWIDRTYDLRKGMGNAAPDGDTWLLELAYQQIADYYPGITFNPQQRVAFAAEIFDSGEEPLNAQSFIQSLPIASTMVRLSIPPQAAKAPVIVRPLS
jgi:hypothetical protein